MPADKFKQKEEESIERLVEDPEEETTDRQVGSSIKEHDPTERVGKLMGTNYEILAFLGEGGMSTVYKARHLMLDRKVAIKFISPKLLHDKSTIMRFQQEAQAATELQHAGICGVREFGVDDAGVPYLVMDFVDGQSLADLLDEQGALEHDRAIEIIYRVCEAIEHAHSRGVIHRDIKPANIILTKERDGSEGVRLVDFGIAKIEREDESGPNLTKTGDVFGTPNYMSPEQCLGRTVDKRSDIYSIGCVLYHLLSGRAPFESASTLETLMKHVNDDVDALGGVDGDVNHLIRRCMEKSADDRYSSAALLKEDISDIKSGIKLKVSSSLPSRIGGKSDLGGAVKVKLAFVVAGMLTACLLAGLLAGLLSFSAGPKDALPPATVNTTVGSFAGLDSNTAWGKKHHEADLEHRSGKTEAAFKLYREAVRLARQSNAPANDLAYLNVELAGCANYLGKQIEAREAFADAARFSKESGNTDQYQRSLGGLAATEFGLKDYDNAFKHYEEIIAIMEPRVSSDQMMAYWESVGEKYFEAGRLERAGELFGKVLAVERKNPGLKNKSLALSNWYLGKIEAQKGNKQEARELISEALRLARFVWLPDDQIGQIEKDIENLK